MLRRWQLELEQHEEKAFPGTGKPVDEELTRLQRENQRLKQEVEILWRQWASWTCRSNRAFEVRLSSSSGSDTSVVVRQGTRLSISTEDFIR
jgi:hypothetical protein